MEDSLFICNPCLGNKDQVKMKRQPNGEECRFCTRPFATLRWSGDTTVGKMRKTVICDTCARARNCCQACSADIDFQIPLELRDAAIKLAGLENPWSVENTSKNREVRANIGNKLEKTLREGEKKSADEKKEQILAILVKLAEKLGSHAPSNPSVHKERSSGNSKELTLAIANLPFGGTLSFPKDETATSFFVFGFSAEMPQYKLQEFFEQHGQVESVKIIHRARCGYVMYQNRALAEKCASYISEYGLSSNPNTAGLVLVDNQPIRISWGNSQKIGKNNEEHVKVALVVSKVMKQLAERDSKLRGMKRHQGEEKSHKKQKTVSGTSGSSKESTKAVSYKALSKDVEF